MEYVNRPLIQKLVEFKEKDPISFHVPGHKGGILSGLPIQMRTALSYDFTELDGLDDLHEPTGVILEAEKKLTTFYNSDKSFFLVNGSTVGNLAMIYAVCREGDTVIVQRNAHKSIFNALELTAARPVFVTPEWDSSTCTASTVTAEQINMAIDAHPEAKAVILTYPTYYGTTGEELEKIILFCHERKIPVLVDEAHGAHFVVGNPFPHSALNLGADVVVHSAHKTLPAMTMASFLHVRSNLVSSERVGHFLRMLQSSSPSYLLMASLDDARAYAENYHEEDKMAFMMRRNTFITNLRQIPDLQTIETDDPLKLIIRIEGVSGFDLQKELNMVGIYVELADFYQVLLVLPLLKKEHVYPFEEISNNIRLVAESMNESSKASYSVESLLPNEKISQLFYTARELDELESKWIPFEQAVGTVAAASIIPYPPGIPLLLAGEKVTEWHVQSLMLLVTTGASFQGAIRVNKKQILVVMDGVKE